MPAEVQMSDQELAQVSPAGSPPQGNLNALERDINDAMSAHRRVNELVAASALGPGLWLQKLVRRSLAWYTPPIQLFQRATIAALGRMLTALQETQTTVAENASIAKRLESQVRHVRESQATLMKEHASLLDKVELFRRVAEMRTSSKLLRENDRVVEYWNQAAETDPMRETVTQGLDETDEEYQKNWKKIGEYVAGKIMSYSVPQPVALEIGPGMGRITVPMSACCKSITALDISPVMAARAQEVTASLDNVEIQVITDEDLGFLPSDHFDLAYSIACFQHADKKTFYRYLQGMRRALKSGGVLFFGVLDLSTELGWGHFEAIVKNDYPEFFHTPDEISAYLKHAGYSSFELENEGETLWVMARR